MFELRDCPVGKCHYKECEKLLNGYCGKHQTEWWKQYVESRGLKVCRNYLRGCRKELDTTYEFTACKKCLEEERTYDKSRNNKKTTAANDKISDMVKNFIDDEDKKLKSSKKYKNNDDNIEIEFKGDEIVAVKKVPNDKTTQNKLKGLQSLINEVQQDINNKKNDEESSESEISIKIDKKTKNETTKKIVEKYKAGGIDDDDEKYYSVCRRCPLKNNMHPLREFIEDDDIKLKCSYHREAERIAEGKRKPRKRDYKAEMERNPSLRETKRMWKENNPEKCAIYWMNSRWRQIERDGIDEYLRKNAEAAKTYRAKNKDKCEELYKQKRMSPYSRLKYYKHRAKNSGIEWKLDDDFAILLFNQECYYCGEMDEFGLNGIDRINNNGDYDIENVVSCCVMCNFMKSEMDQEIYMKKIEHILLNMVIIFDGKYCSELFDNHCSTSYTEYKNRADKLGVEFMLSEEQFDKIRRMNCYMCGKKSGENHINGIDRIDNGYGYNLDNCLPCCADCNYIKNKFDIAVAIKKLLRTYNIKNKKNANENVQSVGVLVRTYLKYCKEKMIKYIGNNNVNSTNKKSENAVKMKIKRNNLIQKYGEDGAKKIQANKKQIARLKRKNPDDPKIQQLQTELKNIIDNKIIVNARQKLSKEQIRENAKIRKQQQRERMRQTLGNEEYKKKHALEIAEQRRKKKEKELSNKDK